MAPTADKPASEEQSSVLNSMPMKVSDNLWEQVLDILFKI